MIWMPDVFHGSLVYPDASHLFYSVVLSVIVTFVRSSIERWIFKTCVIVFSIIKIVFFFLTILIVIFLILSSYFWEPLGIRNGIQSSKAIEEKNQPSELQYFKECGWRFVHHTTLFVIGIFILLDKPWLWNIDECWTNLPNQVGLIFLLNFYEHYEESSFKRFTLCTINNKLRLCM